MPAWQCCFLLAFRQELATWVSSHLPIIWHNSQVCLSASAYKLGPCLQPVPFSLHAALTQRAIFVAFPFQTAFQSTTHSSLPARHVSTCLTSSSCQPSTFWLAVAAAALLSALLRCIVVEASSKDGLMHPKAAAAEGEHQVCFFLHFQPAPVWHLLDLQFYHLKLLYASLQAAQAEASAFVNISMPLHFRNHTKLELKWFK